MANTPAAPTTNGVLIPEGLLRSVNSGIYSYSRRDAEEDGHDPHTLSQIIEQPTQAVLATHPVVQRSRTPEFDHAGRPQTNLRRAPTSLSSRVRSPDGREKLGRTASINVATLLRRKRSDRPPSPLVLFNQRATGSPEVLKPAELRRPTPVYDETHSRRVSSLSRVPEIDQSYQTWSPTHQAGRLSIHSPPEDLLHPRQVSFAPGRESITVRRPTFHAEQPQAPFPPAIGNNGHGALISKASPRARQSSIRNTFEKAKSRQKVLQRSKTFQWFFRYTAYLLLLAFVYFVLVGRPLWGGTVWYIYVLFEYHLTFVGGSAIFVGLAFFYAFGPLLTVFEHPAILEPGVPRSDPKSEKQMFPPAPFIRCFAEDVPSPQEKLAPDGSSTTALLIPCYKSAGLLPATLEAALEIFPATSIYILANGNSATPLDDTEEVCTQYGVNHIWIPVGSKIVAQYVGSYVVRHSFPHVLLIDDDCLLPPNFPVVVDRLVGNVKCLGYTLKSIGANRSLGTWCQQAQDLEYKLSGLQRSFAGKIGSATFPHGAIVLWDTEFLIQTFKQHPGFSVSEDWFFGHVARILGSRITMCSSVFVETETPSSVFFAARGGARGGFGEMTVFKQRFKRWNFFFVNGCYYNLAYILFSWRLGFWEIGAKLFVFQEVYETFLYLITPLVLPISFFVRPAYTAYLFAATLGLYLLNSMIFNEFHLRRAGQMVGRRMLIFYYMPFKLALTFVNVASCWWSLWQYAKYFAKKHPRIIDDVGAVGVVLKIEEQSENDEKAALEAAILRQNHDDDDDKDKNIPSTMRRAGAVKSSKPGTRHRRTPPDPLHRMDSERSAISQRSTGMKARRLTVTAVKVDIVHDPVAVDEPAPHDDQIQQHHQTQDQHQPVASSVTLPDNVGPTEIPTDEIVIGLTRARSMSGGVFGQLNNWVPEWTSSSSSGARRPSAHVYAHRGAEVLEQLDEEEDEDEDGLGGYTYYGV